MQQHSAGGCITSSAQFWPNDHNFRTQLSLPLTLSLYPVQPVQPAVEASFPSNKINLYRCQACKAFINKLCTIQSKNEFICSICGCTNQLTININSLSPEMMHQVYTCRTDNPAHRVNNSQTRTYAFAIDLSQYGKQGEETRNFVYYTVHIIKQYLKIITQQQKHNKIQVFIYAFDDHIHEYSISIINNQSDIQGQSQIQIQKQINTHNTWQPDAKLLNKNKYFIQIPKFNTQVQQILDDILSNVTINNDLRGNSKGLLPTLQKIINLTSNCTGKIYIITGVRVPPVNFTQMDNQPEQFKQNFRMNMKKCLPDTLLYLIQKTQMSINFYIYNLSFINMMPLYAISKLTNGQLKCYYPKNWQQFYYQFWYSLCIQSLQLGTETVLKIRYSNGIKLVSVSGQYRNSNTGSSSKNIVDQIQLMSCSPTKLYTFQFSIQGKIHQPHINIQFSILYTRGDGSRVFKIITHSQKLTNNKKLIMENINYAAVNQAYLWAILQNLDYNVRIKNLQITLQQRCRTHIRAIKKYGKEQAFKKASPYIVFVFFFMRHFLLNKRYVQMKQYDIAIQTRSRILCTGFTGLHVIWPLVYTVNQQQTGIVDMRFSQLNQAQIAVVIDQSDYCYVYIVNQKLRASTIKRILQQNITFMQAIVEYQGLKPLLQLLKNIQQSRLCGYVETMWIQDIKTACILDQDGKLGYQNFVTYLTS